MNKEEFEEIGNAAKEIVYACRNENIKRTLRALEKLDAVAFLKCPLIQMNYKQREPKK